MHLESNNKSFRLLRLTLFFLGSYPKTKEEWMDFLGINKSTFYEYRNELQSIGFNILQKNGCFWIELGGEEGNLLMNLLYFSEEEAYVLSKSIDAIEGNSVSAKRLKQKILSFLNREKVIDGYLKKQKSSIVLLLDKTINKTKTRCLIHY